MEFRDAVERIREAGHKLTPQRMEILRALIQARASISAQAVLERAQAVLGSVVRPTDLRSGSLSELPSDALAEFNAIDESVAAGQPMS